MKLSTIIEIARHDGPPAPASPVLPAVTLRAERMRAAESRVLVVASIASAGLAAAAACAAWMLQPPPADPLE